MRILIDTQIFIWAVIDRLLVAQALSEPFRLLTADNQLARYSELVMTVS